MKDDQKMKHKKYKQQTTHQEQPDQMSPSNQSDWMQPADQNPATGKSFWKDRFIPFWMKNKKRNLKILISVFAILIVAVVVVALLYVNNLLNLIGPEDPNNPNNGIEDQIYDEKDFAEIDGIKDANSLKDLVKKWATNGGEKYSSRNVINVLLIGQDDGRSDSMILASINKKTDQITLASFFRDSYSYINYNGEDRYTKMNAAYAWGGPELLIETLENNFKVEIDYYVTVNFENFSKAIDAIGGVYVDVQPYESEYIRRTSRFKNFPVGEHVLLNGDEALVFSRIRKSDADSDISRTRRQRQVITALIQQSKSASLGQLNSLANKILPYVNTNIPKSTILSYGTQAILQGWMNYPINQITVPSEEYRQGQYINGVSFIIVDYQAAARELQMALYGNSNIPEGNHVSPFDLDLSSSSSSGSNSNKGNNGSSSNYVEPTSNQQQQETTDFYNQETTGEEDESNITQPVTSEPSTSTEENPSTNEGNEPSHTQENMTKESRPQFGF